MSARSLSDGERRDWLRLSRSENVGPSTFRDLLRRYGTAKKALAALPELSRRGGINRSISVYGNEEADDDLARAKAAGAQFVALGEDGYPPALGEIDSAPPLLCVKGDLSLARREAVAIVGARNASAAGRKFARMLAGDLGAAGYLVISGLARGIDTAAHEAALERGTAAVLANGIDVVYPPENQALQSEIGRIGLLVSEMPPGTAPRAELFPRRNRIIAGMSRATIVVEAAMRSGSLITARFANEQGRDVFAVPGSPLDPRCEGTNRLIKDGAGLVMRAQDVIDGLRMLPALRTTGDGLLEDDGTSGELDGYTPDARGRILTLLGHTPIEINDLIRESGLAPGLVSAILLELEIAGKVTRHGRQMVSLA
ncbi:DNA-processing protein DprA [soil metagenome]